MNLLQKVLPVFFALIFIQGCYRDEIINPDTPSNQPHKLGVYILSEGNSQPDQSRLSFLSYYNGEFSVNITFPSLLGFYPDGLTDYNGYLFALSRGTEGGPGKIYKIDTTGVILDSKQLGINPYSLIGVNGKLYCTDGTDSSVLVVDANSLSQIKKIKTGLNPQEITSIAYNVFAANTSIHGFQDSTISVINSITDTPVFTIKIAGSPTSLAVSSDGYLLAGSSAYGGIIYKINSNNFSKADSFLVSSLSIKDISVDYYTGKIFFISNNNSIKSLNPNTREVTSIISSLPELQYINGYAYDTKNKKHFVVDAKDFSAFGVLYKFDASGVLENQYGLGYSPRRILIRN